MFKTKKNHKHLFLLIKVVLFIGVLYLLYTQLKRVEGEDWESFSLEHPVSFTIALLLVYPNIYLAYAKWKLTLKTIGIHSTQKTRVQSFFAGVVTGIITPNMLGNFIGRFYYFDKQYRAQITAFTMLSNFAQFLASLTFGLVAVLIVGDTLGLGYGKQLMIIFANILMIAYLTFFFVDNLLKRFKKREFAKRFQMVLKASRWYRMKLLGLSFGRFIIFTAQFSLMLHAFGAPWNIWLIAAIWQVYLFTMIAPSLFLGKFGVKEFIALAVLSQLGINELSIVFSSLLIWVINTLSPVLLGFVLTRKKEEV